MKVHFHTPIPNSGISDNGDAVAFGAEPALDFAASTDDPLPLPTGASDHAKTSSGHRKAGLLMGLALACLCGAGAVGPVLARDLDEGHVTAPTNTSSPTQATAPSAVAGDKSAVMDVAVDDGDTISDLLAAQQLTAANRRAVLAAIDTVFDGASLQPGTHLRLTRAPSAPRTVTAVELTQGGKSIFKVAVGNPAAQVTQTAQSASAQQPTSGGADRSTTAAISATTKPSIWQTSTDGEVAVRHVAGVVGKSFRQTLGVVQVPAPLINQIMLGFRTKTGEAQALPQNAAFDVVYEGVLRDGKFSDPRLQSATVRNGEKTRRIYRYQADDATTALVQEDGHGVALIDLGQPLEIKEKITSPYGWRIHPVFGDRRFHEGVDFGAPTGTPVLAATDGVIDDIGYRGNYGKYVRLKHDGHLSTAYAHLSGFAQGLRRGDTVRRGDVIAYVGRTGVATGPHLYYEVLIDGKQIDPMRAPAAVPMDLSGHQLAAFQKYVEQSPEE